MDLDGHLDELLLKLRAAGDALVVGTRESTAIPSEIVLRLEAAAKAIEIKQERTSPTHVDEPKRLVKVAQAAEVVSKRSDAVLRALRDRQYPIIGVKGSFQVEFRYLLATYPERAKALNEWADKNYPQ